MNVVKLLNEAISSVFSDSGYKVNGFTIKCESPLSISIIKYDESVEIKFLNTLPVASIKKLITIQVSVQAIIFGKTGGILKLKHFPDIKFDYEQNEKAYGVVRFDTIDKDNLVKEINSEYEDEERRLIAKRCLHYVDEWATIVSQKSVDPKKWTRAEKRKFKKQCEQFVKENIKNDKELEYGSVILTIIILNVIVPMIIKWIIERALKNWFN